MPAKERPAIPDWPALMSDVMLALYLNVSERVIRQWRSAAKIPGTVEMPGRVTRTRRADIDEWLAALPTEGK